VGLILVAFLMAKRVTGAIVIAILAGSALAVALGVATLPHGNWLALPRWDTVGAFDLRGALTASGLVLLIPILLVDFFDTVGTATAVAEEAGLADADGRFPGLRRLLLVDAASASIGGL